MTETARTAGLPPGRALPGIRALRQAQGLKQAEAARLIGVSRVAYANWEAGRARPAAQWLPVIAEVLRCSIEQLYEQTGRDEHV